MKATITQIKNGTKTKFRILKDDNGYYKLMKRGFFHWKFIRHYEYFEHAIGRVLQG